jgi:hypothetical protein
MKVVFHLLIDWEHFSSCGAMLKNKKYAKMFSGVDLGPWSLLLSMSQV